MSASTGNVLYPQLLLPGEQLISYRSGGAGAGGDFVGAPVLPGGFPAALGPVRQPGEGKGRVEPAWPCLVPGTQVCSVPSPAGFQPYCTHCQMKKERGHG